MLSRRDAPTDKLTAPHTSARCALTSEFISAAKPGAAGANTGLEVFVLQPQSLACHLGAGLAPPFSSSTPICCHQPRSNSVFLALGWSSRVQFKRLDHEHQKCLVKKNTKGSSWSCCARGWNLSEVFVCRPAHGPAVRAPPSAQPQNTQSQEQGGKEECKYQGGEESTTPLLLGRASQKLSRREGRDEILPGESLLSDEVIVLDLTCSPFVCSSLVSLHLATDNAPSSVTSSGPDPDLPTAGMEPPGHGSSSGAQPNFFRKKFAIPANSLHAPNTRTRGLGHPGPHCRAGMSAHE